MADLQISDIKMPTLREIPTKHAVQPDKEFKFTLISQIGENELQTKIKEMVEEITTQGKKISDHMDIRELKVYRTMISGFFNEIVTNNYKFSRENFLDRRGRHRVYGIIREVNVKLDELSRELLQSERNQVDILKKIGDIQGLILDIIT